MSALLDPGAAFSSCLPAVLLIATHLVRQHLQHPKYFRHRVQRRRHKNGELKWEVTRRAWRSNKG